MYESEWEAEVVWPLGAKLGGGTEGIMLRSLRTDEVTEKKV